MNFCPIDLGAESGRVMLARLGENRLSLTEAHRFPNRPRTLGGTLRWNLEQLVGEIHVGLQKAADLADIPIRAIGVDTWGVDYGLLDERGTLIEEPHHYRDPRTNGILDRAFQQVTAEAIFKATGIQLMQINTLFQLISTPMPAHTRTLLMMPDLINYRLCGSVGSEFTIASTSQCLSPNGTWAVDLLKEFGIPTSLFTRIVQPATPIGWIEIGSGSAEVVAPGSHDTASAVLAVPASEADFAYISSGTWSLVGVELHEPVINGDSYRFNFTNEGGVGGRYRLLKNVMGLWLLQGCQSEWPGWSYEGLAREASSAQAYTALVDPDDASFLAPGAMTGRIADYCLKTAQRAPKVPGEFARCIFESLALKYRWAIERLNALTGRPRRCIHVVGGGSQNALLCQMTADASNLPVYAGPVEATAIGNALAQAIGVKQLAGVDEARHVVRASFELQEYLPTANREEWDAAYAKFLQIAGLPT